MAEWENNLLTEIKNFKKPPQNRKKPHFELDGSVSYEESEWPHSRQKQRLWQDDLSDISIKSDDKHEEDVM